MPAPTPLGEFEQITLLAILRLAGNAYGISIREEIHLCTGRQVSPGALYKTLQRLESKHLLRAREGEPTPERGGRAKRFYTVTKPGLQALTQAQFAFDQLRTGLKLPGLTHFPGDTK
jgi:PadR family transcriptional regulator, regulatory protein PadR